MMHQSDEPQIVVMGGGLGVSRIVAGLQRLELLDAALAVTNVGDDLSIYGLYVCPDFDTVVYALAGQLDLNRTWGIRNDTFSAMERLNQFQGFGWFNLGDLDIATHLYRTGRLAQGATLTEISGEILDTFDLPKCVLPVSNDRVSTHLQIEDGTTIDFQTFHVRHQAHPTVRAVEYRGASTAKPSARVLSAIRSAPLVVVAPSNPVASVLSQLAIPGVEAALVARTRPTVAISPVVSSIPPKGTDEHRARSRAGLLAAIDRGHTPEDVAGLYEEWITAFVMDEADVAQGRHPGSSIPVIRAQTICRTPEQSARLVNVLLDTFG